jgi:hypothetical protein
LRRNTKDYGGKTHWTDSQNSDTTAPNDKELYHLQFLLRAASLETLGYTLVISYWCRNVLPGNIHIYLFIYLKKLFKALQKRFACG